MDFNNTNRLNIDDFIKLMNELRLNLSITEIQNLFHCYEVYDNSLFYYEEMFRDLKNLYHSERRQKFIDLFHSKLLERLNRQVKLTDFKRLFNPRNHPFFNDGVSEDELLMEFFDLIDSFQFIHKLPRNDSIIGKDLFSDFFQFFGFGIDKDETFFDLVSNIFDLKDENNNENIEDVKHLQKNLNFQKNNNHENLVKNFNDNTSNLVNSPLLDKVLLNLKSFSKKTLFSLIKHFKYYDKDTKLINKYDFAKVLRDYRLNLTATDTEKLFETFCQDKKQMLLNYEQFVKVLTERNNSERRINLLTKIYEGLKNLNNNKNNVDLKTMTATFNPKAHPSNKDEDETFKEFNECLDLFHYDYKNRKNSEISLEEFLEFYGVIGLVYEDDESYEKMLKSEWSKLNLNLNQNVVSKNVQNVQNVKNVQRISTPNYDPRAQTPVRDNLSQYERTMTPSTKSIRPLTPLRHMTQDEKEVALAQNQYVKTKSSHSEKKGQDAVEKLKIRLRKRGMRGLMNLHKQFLLSCSNVSQISYGDFVKVLKLQRLDMTKDEYDNIFEKFKLHEKNTQMQFLNFSGFIRNFKKILNENRLNCIEKAFAALDEERSEMLFVDDIKLRFDACRHPDVVKKLRSEEEVIMEFLDCFELNYNFLSTPDTNNESNLVSFEEFANFYEYVSFLYDKDDEFKNVLVSTWKLI